MFNSLLAQLVKYDVHTTRKINLIHAIFYHILSLSCSDKEFFKKDPNPEADDLQNLTGSSFFKDTSLVKFS